MTNALFKVLDKVQSVKTFFFFFKYIRVVHGEPVVCATALTIEDLFSSPVTVTTVKF